METTEGTIRRKFGEYKAAKGVLRSRIEEELIAETKGLTEHPEWYDGPCACQTCLSYGDD